MKSTLPAGSVFSTLADIKAACSCAYADALKYAQRECGRGTFISRGRSVVALRDGNLVAGEAEAWEWDGTLEGLISMIDDARFSERADTVIVQGGINYAASPRDYADCNYDPWVAEWAVTVWRKPEEV